MCVQFNRADELPSQGAMRTQLSMAGKSGWTFVDMLSDFHLLLFLTDFLDMNEVGGGARVWVWVRVCIYTCVCVYVCVCEEHGS